MNNDTNNLRTVKVRQTIVREMWVEFTDADRRVGDSDTFRTVNDVAVEIAQDPEMGCAWERVRDDIEGVEFYADPLDETL